MPGKPAPLPKSDKEPDLKSINLTNWAESSICLCQISATVLWDIKLCFLFALINASTKILSAAIDLEEKLRNNYNQKKSFKKI